MIVAKGVDENELLLLAASLEQRSEHPLARAVLERASESGLQLRDVANVRAIPGKGVTGVVDGMQIAAGNEALFAELGISPGRRAPGSNGSILLSCDRPRVSRLFHCRGPTA
jgi:Cu+-exporting ATPase